MNNICYNTNVFFLCSNLGDKKNREYPIRTDVNVNWNKFQAYRHKPLGQFSISACYIYCQERYMIPRWLEHRTYSYQKYTLPIKLRNPFFVFLFIYLTKNPRALRLELRIWSLKLPILPIKLCSYVLFILSSIGKEMIRTSKC